MARKKAPEEPENHERWLVSYADFITLLFAFFVVMYSTSSVNEGKMRVLSDSLLSSFTGRNKALAPIQVGSLTRSPHADDVSLVTSPTEFVIVAPPNPMTPMRGDGEDSPGEGEGADKAGEPDPLVILDPPLPPALDESPDVPPAEQEGGAQAQDPDLPDVSDVADALRQGMSPLLNLAEIALKTKKSWIEIELDSAKLFVSGSARLSPSAIPILTGLADMLKKFSNPIQVEGFTDNIPIRTLTFPSNWELSAARAASVVHLFTKVGVNPERMVAIGYGEHRPVADNRTPAGRAKNRRVVLVIPADATIRRILDSGAEVELTEGGK